MSDRRDEPGDIAPPAEPTSLSDTPSASAETAAPAAADAPAQTPPPAPGSFVRALKAAELPPGTKKTAQIGGTCVLICNADGRLHAISNTCSHALQPLERGRMSGTWIACPTHGARFDLATGKPLNPPAFKPIATYALRVVDEWIEVMVE